MTILTYLIIFLEKCSAFLFRPWNPLKIGHRISASWLSWQTQGQVFPRPPGGVKHKGRGTLPQQLGSSSHFLSETEITNQLLSFHGRTKVVDSQTLFQNTMDTGMTRVQIVWLPPCLGSPAQPRNLPARCWHFARPNPSANHLPRGWHQHGVNHDKHLRTFKNTVWYCMNQKPSTHKSSPHFHPRFPLMSSCARCHPPIHPALSPSGPTAVPKRRETLKYW